MGILSVKTGILETNVSFRFHWSIYDYRWLNALLPLQSGKWSCSSDSNLKELSPESLKPKNTSVSTALLLAETAEFILLKQKMRLLFYRECHQNISNMFSWKFLGVPNWKSQRSLLGVHIIQFEKFGKNLVMQTFDNFPYFLICSSLFAGCILIAR